MDRDDFLYELAFREIEEGNLDTATWAKAFALSSDDEHAKKLYIQYRVEQNINAPEAYVPDANNTDPEISKEQEPQLVQEPLPESKTSSWLDSFVNIILIVPPVYLAGAWLISLDKGGPNPLGVLLPSMDNGATWFTVLWPFALIYWLLKRSKDKGKHDLSPLMRGDYNWGIFGLVALGLALFFSVNQESYKPINNEISLSSTNVNQESYKPINNEISLSPTKSAEIHQTIRRPCFTDVKEFPYRRAVLEDGTSLQFPIETLDSVVNRTVFRYFKEQGMPIAIDIEGAGCMKFELGATDKEVNNILNDFEKDFSFTHALSDVRKNIPKFPTNLSEFRDAYEQYDDLSDQEVADKVYKNYFSDLSRSEFRDNWAFMNVNLPNGRVIDNVPVGTTQVVLAALAISNGIAKAEDFENLICFEDKYNETWICTPR